VLPAASFTLSPCSYADVRRLQQALGCSETMAWILVRRGVGEVEARALLDGSTDAAAVFHDPLLLGDMAAAVERIQYAIQHHESIVVHGDYDADGVCSTVLITEALEALGAEVRPFLPNRFRNGYGLQLESVERFALDGARLLITVDCGITAVEPVAQAADRGLDVIVCDHHEPGEQLPSAIICSTRPSDYPFPHLCAAGVAGKLVQALGAPYGDDQHAIEAIATVADCVPLVGENRAIVRRGLAALRRTNRPGIRALVATCQLQPSQLDEESIAFKLAPRINAAGRLGDSDRAYELLRAEALPHANILAKQLHEANDERRQIEQRILAEAEAQIQAWPPELRAARAWVVSGAGWHEGVVGIVASRLVERYHRPVVVIAETEPLARGSARSIDAFDMHAALRQCNELLVRWGGHRAAGGVTIEPTRIHEFRGALAAVAAEQLTDADLQPVERVDAVVAGDELNMALVEELGRLAPFGNANERPRLLAVGALVTDAQTVGADGSHLRCRVSVGGVSAQAIGFGMGAHLAALQSGARVDIAVRASVNRFRGSESLQLELDRLIGIPEHPPRVAGMCAVRCTFECEERLGLDRVLARALDGAEDLAAASADLPPALEPILARDDVVDLRHANRALAHVARLATAGARVLLVCADVSRRREMLAGPLHPDRLGLGGAALASSRCSELGISARLRRLVDTPGAVAVLADYGALAQVLDGPLAFDAVVVLDPPVTDRQRDLIAGAPAPVHLVFNAGDSRFAWQVATAVPELRATFGDAWRLLGTGGLSGEALEQALFGSGPHLRSPEAVSWAVAELQRRQLVTAQGGLLERGSSEVAARA